MPVASVAVSRPVFEFIATLIVLSFSCRVLLMLIGTPVRILCIIPFMPLAAGKLDRAGRWAILAAPGLLAVVYGGFIALVTLRFSPDSASNIPWIYAACGGAVAIFSLLSFALGLYAKGEAHLFGPRPEDKYWRITAYLSLAAGLAASVFFYFYPNYILTLPGAEYFFGRVHQLAAWLKSYKVAQIILVVGIVGYFLYTTVAVLSQVVLNVVDRIKCKILGLIRRY